MRIVFGLLLALFGVSTLSAQTVTYTVTDSGLPHEVLSAWKPDSIEEYSDVPKVYQQWWNEISDCAHLKGDFSRVRWWRVVEVDSGVVYRYGGHSSFKCPIVGWCDGWHNDHNIYIAWNRIYEEQLIKHEMLHDLLGPKNIKSPPHHPLFVKCHVN